MSGSTSNTDGIYRKLQQHLNNQPVGFPKTRSGVDLRLLQYFFMEEEVSVALAMSFRFESPGDIYKRMNDPGISLAEVDHHLARMYEHGAILASKQDDSMTYALIPFLIGMYETQVKDLSLPYIQDSREYVGKGFALEMLYAKIPQSRFIPVEQSITPQHAIATYEQLRELIETTAGNIALVECICKKSKGMLGTPCKKTKRLETCMGFYQLADYFTTRGIGRSVSKAEALAVAQLNEREGLILQLENAQNPSWICGCCGDCCGLLEILKVLPRPAELAASNYHAQIDVSKCAGCGACTKACQMKAITNPAKKSSFDEHAKKAPAQIDVHRCIGCGVCVLACKKGALLLEKKTTQLAFPPADTAELYDILGQNKKNRIQKITFLLGILGKFILKKLSFKRKG